MVVLERLDPWKIVPDRARRNAHRLTAA